MALTRHFVICNRIRQDFRQVKKDSTAFVQYLDARFDLQIFANGKVERMESRFGFPEEVGDVEHVGC